MRGKRTVEMKVLRGQPTDGSGKVCVHLFVPDSSGPFVEPHGLHPVVGEDGQVAKQQVVAKPTRGRLACDPRRTVAPVTRNGITIVTMRTDSPYAVTCPRCKASEEYKALMGG
jgi:hypothetical protein